MATEEQIKRFEKGRAAWEKPEEEETEAEKTDEAATETEAEKTDEAATETEAEESTETEESEPEPEHLPDEKKKSSKKRRH